MRYFIDWEFHEDGTVIVPISLGVVAEDGRELYCCSTDFDPSAVNDWVRANVLPQLPPRSAPAWMPRTGIRDALVAFVGADEKPDFWAYYADYDWVATCQLFGRMIDLPRHFPRFCMDLKQWAVQLGIRKLPAQADGEHDALCDARWNRDMYDFLAERAR